MDRALIVYNPNARNAPREERLLAAAAPMQAHGWQIELQPTKGRGDATALARGAVRSGVNVVFACGGDGTINEVVNGLVGSNTALAVLRGGMGDVFAKEASISKSPEAALAVLRDGELRRFDLGVLQGPNLTIGRTVEETQEKRRYFLLMTGVGFDAAVEKAMPPGMKRRFGSTAYAAWAAREIPRYRPTLTRIAINGVVSESEMYWLLAGNTRSYGGVLDITSRARVDDGLLDTYVFRGHGLPWVTSTLIRLFARRQDGAPGVTFARVPELLVDTPGLPVQADGEYVGETPLRFSVAPAAVTILIPRGSGRRLFSPGTSLARTPA